MNQTLSTHSGYGSVVLLPTEPGSDT